MQKRREEGREGGRETCVRRIIKRFLSSLEPTVCTMSLR